MSLDPLIKKCKLIVCVGAGGVGKTTTAASLALAAAMAGRRVMVLTIDPARRLANSLGLREFGNTAVQIDLHGRAPKGGELWAMMLDPRSTLNDLITRVSKDPVTRDALFANRVYKNIAGSFSGSQEYMAAEQLYEVQSSGRYDLIVLDTPPVKNAIDFLDAPGRMTRFMDRQIIKWFLTPYEEGAMFGKRLLMGTSAVVYRLLGHIFGREFLDELSQFFFLLRDLAEGFRERHEVVAQLFASAQSAFVVVSTPSEPAMEVAEFFLRELRRRNFPLAGLIVNQVHQCSTQVPDVEALWGAQARGADPQLAARVLARLGAAHRRLREVAALDASKAEQLRRAAGSGVQVQVVPRRPEEVHDLDGLVALHAHLLGGGL